MSIRFKAITLGIISAFFFSITFVVNEVMANAHGYWATPLLYGTYGCCP